MSKTLAIKVRHRRVINTDPQRRCYDGIHFSSAVVWSEWKVLHRTSPSNAESQLRYWRELNDYAVKERGISATSEYKVEEENDRKNIKADPIR